MEAKHAPATLDSVGIKIPSQGYVSMEFDPLKGRVREGENHAARGARGAAKIPIVTIPP